MTKNSEEFHFRFRSRFMLGMVFFAICVSYYAVALLANPETFDRISPLAGLVLLVFGTYFSAPFILTRKAVIDDSGITFKPINYRYPMDRIKQIKQVYKTNERISAVQLVTEGAPNIWLPMVIVGSNEIVKLNLHDTDGEAFLSSLEKRIARKT